MQLKHIKIIPIKIIPSGVIQTSRKWIEKSDKALVS